MHEFERLQEKVDELLKAYSILLQENEQLQHKLSKSEESVLRQQKEIDSLKSQLKWSATAVSSAWLNSMEKNLLKKQLDQVIKEIEQHLTIITQ